MAGRPIQDFFGQTKQNIMTFELIEGTDGRKMSKSYKNFISLDATANEMFVKLMEIHDNLIIKYFTNCTQLHTEEVTKYEQRLNSDEHPKNIKLELAHHITSMYHGAKGADNAQAYFEKSISGGERPDDADIPVYEVEQADLPLVSLIRVIGMVSNSTEARNAISS